MDIQRTIIIFGLAVTSYLMILAWNEDYGDVAATPAPTTIQTPNQPDDLPTITADGSLPNTADGSLQNTAEGSQLIPTVTPIEVPAIKPVSADKKITVSTDVLNVTIDLRGGDIIEVSLPKFPTELDSPDQPFILVDPRNSFVAQSGLIGPDGIDKSGQRPTFNASSTSYSLGTNNTLNVDITTNTDNGLAIVKRFIFTKGEYLIDIKYLLKNESSEVKSVAFFSQIKRDGEVPFDMHTNKMGLKPFVGAATRTGDELYSKLKFSDIEEEGYKGTVEGGYMALVQHYFVSAWIPDGDGPYNYVARKLTNQNIYLVGFTTPLVTVPPGADKEIGARFYAGPKDQYRLEEIAEGLNLTVDYGFLWWLAQPLFSLLTFLHGVFGNWGVAIILLTVIVKTLLFPLSAASFKSMAKMRKLQPEMARLKERYGDDRQQFSQAMMDLYKKEGANPLGGCFPILLQMPVFLALYWTLMESVELRQAPFMLWIYDLSVMDPYFVLPILMGGSMFLTQSMQPAPPDPMQAKVMKYMPVMFTFFFLWFPSGLVLYWLVNNMLSVAQQWFVTRQLEKASQVN